MSSAAMRVATVVGATGVQGGAVAQEFLKRGGWAVRTITRNPEGAAAKSLKAQGVEIFKGDINNKEDLTNAFKGANFVFANTVSQFTPEGHQEEERSGKLMADVAKEQHVNYFIYSSEENANEISQGALLLPMFTVKANIEKYLFNSGVPSSAVQMASYMENFKGYSKPQVNAEGVYEYTHQVSGDSTFPLIYAAELGQVVFKMVENKEQYLGKKFFVAGDNLTPNQVASVLSKVWKVPVKFKHIPPAEFAKMPYPGAAAVAEMCVYWDKYGHAGEKVAGSKRDVFEAKKICPTLSTLEQYLEKEMPSPPPKTSKDSWSH